jgi:two-component system, NtrC family, response regulator HydG
VSSRVLIVDDEPRMADSIAVALRRRGHVCVVAGSGTEALARHAEQAADVVITDLKMPGMDGFELLENLAEAAPGVPVIVLTAHGDVPSAVDAMRRGAFHFLTKPFDNDELRSLVARALELSRLQRENSALRRELRQQGGAELVASSVPMQELLALVDRAAASTAPVLVHGETGTGKEVIARRLHLGSDRALGPFVAVNCTAFSAGILESELFGHERGAFTGASGARAGCFERADGGTLLLDEIGEIGPEFQAKLLRVLQEGEVLRVGADRPRKIDVRIVGATNRDLRREVEQGRFREDLFFRLAVIPVHVPPLRQRRDDVLPLADLFLGRHAKSTGRALHFSDAARSALLRHGWPGNVRELENAVERAVVLARGDSIGPEDLLLDARAEVAVARAGSLQDALDRAAEARIRAALAAAAGRRADAAVTLGIERTTLYRLMKRLGIDA